MTSKSYARLRKKWTAAGSRLESMPQFAGVVIGVAAGFVIWAIIAAIGLYILGGIG